MSRPLRKDGPDHGGINGLDWMNPPIAARRHRLEEPGLARLVTQCASNLRDDTREGVVGDGGPGPDEVEDFLFGKEVTRPLNHHSEQVERLGLERDRHLVTFEAVGVEIENVAVPAVS